VRAVPYGTESAWIYWRIEWFSLLSCSDQAHVDAPNQSDDAEEYDPPLDWDETEAYDRCDWPDFVACDDDGNGVLRKDFSSGDGMVC
jgi:hypothetical protein